MTNIVQATILFIVISSWYLYEVTVSEQTREGESRGEVHSQQ